MVWLVLCKYTFKAETRSFSVFPPHHTFSFPCNEQQESSTAWIGLVATSWASKRTEEVPRWAPSSRWPRNESFLASASELASNWKCRGRGSQPNLHPDERSRIEPKPSNVVVALFIQTKGPKLATWRKTKATNKACSSLKSPHSGRRALLHDLRYKRASKLRADPSLEIYFKAITSWL